MHAPQGNFEKTRHFRDMRGLQTHPPPGYDPGAHITKNPNFDPILTFSHFHKKVRIDPNFFMEMRKS